jgi:hypothetical protein
MQVVNEMFTPDPVSIGFDENNIQRLMVEYGNRSTSYSFVPVDIREHSSNNQTENHTEIGFLTNAHIQPSQFRILLIGEQSSDPILKLIVEGHYSLTKSNHPDTCMGWYSAEWAGSSRRLSLWSENNASLLKEEVKNALLEQYQEAISFLFSTDENSETRYEAYASYPEWLGCYEARYKNIINHAEWFCMSADNGIADSQRRIGDLYYQSGVKEGLVRAYVWYSLASDGNNTVADNSLSMVIQELAPDQIAQAKHLLNEWKPGYCKTDLLLLAKQI